MHGTRSFLLEKRRERLEEKRGRCRRRQFKVL
jgi:hypothetical protein